MSLSRVKSEKILVEANGKLLVKQGLFGKTIDTRHATNISFVIAPKGTLSLGKNFIYIPETPDFAKPTQSSVTKEREPFSTPEKNSAFTVRR